MRLAEIIPRKSRIPRVGEYDGQEERVLREAQVFRTLAELSWDKTTVHPRSDYIAGSSKGHCGITNFGFGIWLSWRHIVHPSQMFYEEVKIARPDGSLIGDDHACLRVGVREVSKIGAVVPIRFDLAGDQFPDIDVPVVVQYDDYPDLTSARCDLLYEGHSTPLPQYDIRRFKGRLGRLMINVVRAANDPTVLPTDIGELLRWDLTPENFALSSASN